MYEKLIYNQLPEYTESFLSHISCGFRRAHSTQHALFKLLQSWQKELDNGGFVSIILIDLSKAYDSIPHELLIAKLKFYGIGNGSLRLFLIVLLIGNKGRILVHLLVHGVILTRVYHKDQSLVLFFLIFS